jgi:hypothetical protein
VFTTTSRRCRGDRPIAGAMALVAILSAANVAAQPASAPLPAATQPEPLRCWWRTSAPAIRIGEAVSVVLTCATVETPSLSVVVDETRLGPEAIQLSPFEVLSGTRAVDQRLGDHRFFQHEYLIRLINDTLFGEDVPLPPVTVAYRLASRVSGGESLEGVEKTYELPPQPMRVQSLVPADASDIRDASPVTFRELDGEAFSARLFISGGNVLMAVGGVLAVVALVTAMSGRKAMPTAAAARISDRAVLRTAGRELSAIKIERQADGWSAERVRRALAAVRVGAAHALGRPIAQHAVGSAAPVGGALLYRRRDDTHVAVSGAVTPGHLARALAATAGADSTASQALEELRDALSTLTCAGYGSAGTLDAGPLDEALAAAERQVGSLLRASGRYPQIVAGLSSRLSGLGRRVRFR